MQRLDITDNKSYDKADIYISAKTGINIDELLEILREKTSLYDNEIKSNAAAITERHHNILQYQKKYQLFLFFYTYLTH